MAIEKQAHTDTGCKTIEENIQVLLAFLENPNAPLEDSDINEGSTKDMIEKISRSVEDLCERAEDGSDIHRALGELLEALELDPLNTKEIKGALGEVDAAYAAEGEEPDFPPEKEEDEFVVDIENLTLAMEDFFSMAEKLLSDEDESGDFPDEITEKQGDVVKEMEEVSAPTEDLNLSDEITEKQRDIAKEMGEVSALTEDLNLLRALMALSTELGIMSANISSEELEVLKSAWEGVVGAHSARYFPPGGKYEDPRIVVPIKNTMGLPDA